MEFEGRVSVITGAAMGIGVATVEAFVRAGARVLALDLNPVVGELAERFSGKVISRVCNVADGREVAAAFEQAAASFGAIDFLVNNAGIQRYGTVTETSEALWEEVMNVNLKSAFLCAQQALPLMQKKGHGVIINVGSVQSFLSQQRVAAYTTSKSALLGLTRSIAVDYAPHIRCLAVCPGTVDTPMLRWAIAQSPDPEKVLQECMDMHPLKRIAQPKEIAEMILYLCGDRAAFMTGQYVRVDGGLGITIPGSQRD